MAPVCLFLADAARHDGETAESLPFQEQRTNRHRKRKPSQPMGALVAWETRRSDPPSRIHPRVTVHVRRSPPNVRDACRVVTGRSETRRWPTAEASVSAGPKPERAQEFVPRLPGRHSTVEDSISQWVKATAGPSKKQGGFLGGRFRRPRILVSCCVFWPVLHRPDSYLIVGTSQLLCNAHSKGGLHPA